MADKDLKLSSADSSDREGVSSHVFLPVCHRLPILTTR